MNTRHDMWRPSRWANLHMSRFVSHPAGAELGGVGETTVTTKENQCAHNEAGEKPPSVAYESDAVRRLDTTPPPPAGSADGRRRRSGQIGGDCLFVGVDSARRPPRGPSRRQLEVRTSRQRRIGIVRVEQVTGTATTVAVSAGNQRPPPSLRRTQTTRGNTTATFDFVSILLAFSPDLGEDPP